MLVSRIAARDWCMANAGVSWFAEKSIKLDGDTVYDISIEKSYIFVVEVTWALKYRLLTKKNSDNNIEVIPDEIVELTNLVNLELSNNLIYFLPDELGNLINLEKLLVSNNKLQNIPTTIWYSLSSFSQV